MQDQIKLQAINKLDESIRDELIANLYLNIKFYEEELHNLDIMSEV